MMLLLGGRERSLKQYNDLLQAASLRPGKVVSEIDGWMALEVTAIPTSADQSRE
jgi:hypothetical protein